MLPAAKLVAGSNVMSNKVQEDIKMGADEVKAFIAKLADDEFRNAFNKANTDQAKKLVLDKAGLSISVEEATAAMKGEGELADQDLDEVAGGDAGVIRFPYPPPPTNP
jgi:hypothetical protein